jgi:hypothetical protein
VTGHRLGTGDSYQAGEGYFQHWRSSQDRRFWWISVAEPMVNCPMCLCVMDDFGNLVRVSEVV